MGIKVYITVVLICVFLSNTFSQENAKKAYNDFPFAWIVFYNTTVEIMEWDVFKDTELHKQGQYELELRDGVPFLNINWGDSRNTYLMLRNDLMCFIYEKDGYPRIAAYSGILMRNDGVLPAPDLITATSFLTESRVAYMPDLTDSKLGQAWVEGVRGQGLHEKLFITQPRCTALHISIGFVSFTKPYLYQENSRPKVINVSVEGKFSFAVDLLDTPNFQTIILPQRLGITDQLVIEILDVYPGTKYEDTCINCILYDIIPMNENHYGN